MEKLQSYLDDDNEQNDEEDDLACEKCAQWVKHAKAAKSSRHHYQSDTNESAGVRVRSGDLQKVIMLPRMPGNKTAIFTRRIIAFHQTFASVGKKSDSKTDTISVLWHEGVTGRNQEDITSAFVKMLKEERDVTHMILWLDNCAAQNKNWCLLSTLVALVNSDSISLEDITLKYFEKGHTFMSVDSVHHGVEREMANQHGGNIYDYPEFVRACDGLSVGLQFELFDTMIKPILLYSSEIWGFTVANNVEKIQTNFCKYVLGVPTHTSNRAVMSETGRLPLYVNYFKRCIKYWLKVISMSSNRYPNACYKMLHELDQQRRTTWATSVRLLLCKYGFEDVWLEQGVGDRHLFFRIFTDKVTESYMEEWEYDVSQSSKLFLFHSVACLTLYCPRELLVQLGY